MMTYSSRYFPTCFEYTDLGLFLHFFSAFHVSLMKSLILFIIFSPIADWVSDYFSITLVFHFESFQLLHDFLFCITPYARTIYGETGRSYQILRDIFSLGQLHFTTRDSRHYHYATLRLPTPTAWLPPRRHCRIEPNRAFSTYHAHTRRVRLSSAAALRQ